MVSSISISIAVGSCVIAFTFSRPLHFRRHRGEDGLYVAAGLQAEDGASIVEQIEFNVASAPDQLFFTVGRAPRRVEIAPDDFGINLQKGAADILGKGEVGIPVAGIVPVVEDSADAARLFAMWKIEVFVAPSLVFWVARDFRVRVAGGLHRRMEGNRVGIILGPPPVQHRRQVPATAEPWFSSDNEPGVHVHAWSMRIANTRDQRNAGRTEGGILGRA